jgi:hypothetical protein
MLLKLPCSCCCMEIFLKNSYSILEFDSWVQLKITFSNCHSQVGYQFKAKSIVSQIQTLEVSPGTHSGQIDRPQ